MNKDKDISLEEFYAEWSKLHQEYFPNEYFGKLTSDVFGWIAFKKGFSIVYLPNKDVLKYFEEYCKLYGIGGSEV